MNISKTLYDIIIGNSTVVSSNIQIHTVGATVTIANNNRGLYVNPASTLLALEITMPTTPINGQEILLSFGGTITSGAVVTTLTFVGTILGVSAITSANAGDGYILKYDLTNLMWRIF